MKVVLVHGWGFGPSVWDDMIPSLSGHECITPDLGFIGCGDKDIRLPEEAVMVGHSLGAMWLLKYIPDTVRGFISIGGFDCFSAHIPSKQISAMQRNLAHNPEAQMNGFYRVCGIDHTPPADKLNTPQLSAGLEWLAGWDEHTVLTALSCPVMALAAEDDSIVPPAMTHAIWDDYDLRMIKTGGHILPLTKPEWCAQQVKGFIDAL